LGRIIGLIGGTCVLIAVVRLTNLQHEDHTLRAGTEAAQSQPQLAPRDAYRHGKEAYLRGKYDEALPLLEAAANSAAGLTEIDRRNAVEYLSRTQLKMAQQAAGIRAQSPDSDPFAFENESAAGSDPVADATRTRVERLMNSARAALKKGDQQEAYKLALQANQLSKTVGLKFDAKEQTPAAFLAQLQNVGSPVTASKAAGRGPTELPEWADPATGVTTAAGTASSSGIELVSAETVAEPVPTPKAPASSNSKAHALSLVKSARADLKAGQLEEARRKALQAQQMGVAYDLFDDRPELLLAEIDRRGGTNTILNNVAQAEPAAAPAAPATAGTGSDKQQAARLLELARQDLKNGNMAGAQEKAQQAQQLSVAYKLFEDRPELVMNDIAAFQAASNIAQKSASPTKATTAAGSPEVKKQAKDLLAQARAALTEGRMDDARQLARDAESLKATYGLFDDRPEIVLADVARATARGDGKATAITEAPLFGQDVATKADEEDITLTPQQKAARLLQDARQLMDAGQYDEARIKAEQAGQINIAYGVFSDRPDVILGEIAQAQAGNVSAKTPTANVQTADVQFTGDAPAAKTFPASQTANRKVANSADFDAPPIVVPGGLSAVEYYNLGLAELGRGNRDAALQAFAAAHSSGQRLDSVRTQRLQDYMRELSPRNASKIQQTSRQTATNDLSVAPFEEPNPIDAAAQAESVKFDRMRTETLNAVFRAERLREKDPEQSLEIIDRQMAAVEGAELGEQAALSLMRSLQKTHTSLQNEIMQQKPNLDQKRKNEEVLAALERDRNNKLRVEEEFAKLVDEYNTLFEQRRYAEAEVVSKKAKELDPKNPVTQTLFWKARMARRVESNEQLKLDKEENFIRTLDEVEQALVNKVGDNPIDFGESWSDITKRRPKGKYGVDNRTRSDEEIRIEESLKRRISLHEDGATLGEVMKKISTLVGINIVFDQLGLEEEGVTSNVPVAIDVDGITVKSALNLMLEPHRLGYMVEDEVLKVTSRMRQQGELVVATYPVADLVIPIPNFLPANTNPFQIQSPLSPMQMGGGGQFSVPTAGQPFAQVGPDPLSGTGSQGADRMAGAAPRADFNTLTDLITSTISPDSWDNVAGSGAIRHYETTLSLVVRQTQKVHEEIADLLEQLRRLQDLQVTIEVRFVTVSDRFFERIGIDFDFNIQDSVGGPDIDNNNIPLLPFGAVQIPQAGQVAQAGQAQQQGQQNQAQGGGGFFNTNIPNQQLLNRDSYPKNTVVGLSAPETFSSDLDVPFRQGSFEVGVPTFGGFNPNAGVQMGLAVLSDIEAFFFIQAAQGDSRANLLFAPKVTLFNGQLATVFSGVSRPFVVSVVPTVGFFSAGFQPIITSVFDGVNLTVQAVISADRRFVRLTVLPTFQNLTDVFTFSFQGGGGIGGQGGGGQLGQQGLGGGLAGGGGGGQFGGGGGGGGQFGIGGGLGMQQMLGASMFTQQQNQGGNRGNQNQGGQNNQAAGNQTVTVQQPVTETVNVSTTVSVPDGGTVLLGGVKRLREGRNMAGVPILNKIPYVSRLFKNTGVGRETESLMLMVTPRIIIQEEEEELLGIPTE
jgi:general secretion pathway protein D